MAEPAGWGLLGFDGDYLALTVPHMLFAGFGACLVVALVTHAQASPVSRVAAVAAPTGVLLVLAGYFVSDAAEAGRCGRRDDRASGARQSPR